MCEFLMKKTGTRRGWEDRPWEMESCNHFFLAESLSRCPVRSINKSKTLAHFLLCLCTPATSFLLCKYFFFLLNLGLDERWEGIINNHSPPLESLSLCKSIGKIGQHMYKGVGRAPFCSSTHASSLSDCTTPSSSSLLPLCSLFTSLLWSALDCRWSRKSPLPRSHPFFCYSMIIEDDHQRDKPYWM